MPFQLILSQATEEKTKDVGENVFLDNLPSDYQVYLFCYSGVMPDENLENNLRKFGQVTGKNLFVQIGRLNDPNYKQIAKKFGITSFPVLIMTAIDRLASSPIDSFTAYVRIDSQTLLDRPDLTLQCIEKLFNLFIAGKISEAMAQFKQEQRAAILARLKDIAYEALKGIGGFLKELDISWSVAEGKLEIKHKGG
jgi:hypothetical protein